MTVVASNYARKENDLYQTEPWATEALLSFLPIDTLRRSAVWEPAAGNHLIADVLRDSGIHVITSDVKRYDRDHDQLFDFFTEGEARVHAHHVITNPPYGKGNRIAVDWARLCLKRCPGWIALLLTAKFDFGKTRMDLFANNPRFWGKLALVDRIQWFPGDTTGTEDHAWYIWAPHPGDGHGLAKMLYGGRARSVSLHDRGAA